jgi:hypothetical protein
VNDSLATFTTQFHFVARPNVGRVYSRSHDAMIRFYDAAGNVIETELLIEQFRLESSTYLSTNKLRRD